MKQLYLTIACVLLAVSQPWPSLAAELTRHERVLGREIYCLTLFRMAAEGAEGTETPADAAKDIEQAKEFLVKNWHESPERAALILKTAADDKLAGYWDENDCPTLMERVLHDPATKKMK